MGPNIPSEAGPLLGEHHLYRDYKVAPNLAVQFKIEYPKYNIIIFFYFYFEYIQVLPSKLLQLSSTNGFHAIQKMSLLLFPQLIGNQQLPQHPRLRVNGSKYLPLTVSTVELHGNWPLLTKLSFPLPLKLSLLEVDWRSLLSLNLRQPHLL